MTIEIATKSKTEAELESRVNRALRDAVPWLKAADLKHQLTFSFRLGRNTVVIDGSRSSRRQARLDMLIEHAGKRLAILELKRPGEPLTAEDVDQGLSYARVLDPRPPITIVSNGTETRTYATHSGELLRDGVPDAEALAALVENALRVAESDLDSAVGTLMGPRSDVWTAAVRAASDEVLADLTGEWSETCRPLVEGFHIPRKAAAVAEYRLKGPRRVIAIEGSPLSGKTHVLRELALRTRHSEELAVLLVEASGTAATGIAEEIARILSSAVGWRIGAADARQWLETLGNSDGPTLVIAVDGLGLEHDAIRSELEALTARSVGSRVKFVIEADTSVVDRLWSGESRRKETAFARRGERILVERLDDEEFGAALKILEGIGVTFMPGADKADEYRQPWLLRSMAASVLTAPQAKKGMTAIMPPLLSIDFFGYVRDEFTQPDLVQQAATFARAVLDDYSGAGRSAEVVLRGMHTFLIPKAVLRKHADADELEAMRASSLLGAALDERNRALATGRIPELIASELAREVAVALDEQMGDAEEDEAAADWLVGVAALLPFGDIIAAQALVDLGTLRTGISVPFINRLLGRRPKVSTAKPGTRAIAWLPEIGCIDVRTREDGVTVLRSPGWERNIEIAADEGETYDELDAWLILSHIAAVPMGALASDDDSRVVGLVHPAILALVGTSAIPLRRVADDVERTGHHTHRGPRGEALTCSSDGIIEPITFSLLRFLEREQGKADAWLDEACNEGSAALLNRMAQALAMISRLNPKGAASKWARKRLEQKVAPALKKSLEEDTLSGDEDESAP